MIKQLDSSNQTITELNLEKLKFESESFEASKNISILTDELDNYKIQSDKKITYYKSLIAEMNQKHDNILNEMTNLKNNNSNLTLKIT